MILDRKSLILSASIAMITSFTACDNGQPTLAPVSGQVTLDGQPLADAAVIFKQEGSRASVGMTNETGQYELMFLRDMNGAVLGEHRVTISTANEDQPEQLPARYHRESVLSFTVLSAGSGAADFALTSHQSAIDQR